MDAVPRGLSGQSLTIATTAGRMDFVELVWPTRQHLASYLAALRRGWSPSSTQPSVAEEEAAQIESNPAEFLDWMDDRSGHGPSVTLPDGTTVPRLPGFRRWMWDGEFCGFISVRWQAGTAELPPHCLGHIGYGTVPWKRERGYATSALRQVLPLARDVGLPYVDLTTDPDNVASQRVILANGGELIEQFHKPPSHGGGLALRFRIRLTRAR